MRPLREPVGLFPQGAGFMCGVFVALVGPGDTVRNSWQPLWGPQNRQTLCRGLLQLLFPVFRPQHSTGFCPSGLQISTYIQYS